MVENLEYPTFPDSEKAEEWHSSMTDMKVKSIRGWTLPASGYSYETCGKPVSVGCLEEHKHKHSIYSSNGGSVGKLAIMNCKRASCPVCSRTWLIKETEYATKRIEKGENLHKWRRAIHATISLPKEWYILDDDSTFHNLRRRINYWLKKAGMKGYMLVYHPFRQYKGEKYKNSDLLGQWYYSPHFHVVGYGWINHTAEIFEKTGLVIKNIGVRKSIGATIYYQLSHCGVKSNRETISWVGTLSNYSLVVKRDKPKKDECPICGNKMVPIHYIGQRGLNPFEGCDEDQLIAIKRSEFKYIGWAKVSRKIIKK